MLQTNIQASIAISLLPARQQRSARLHLDERDPLELYESLEGEKRTMPHIAKLYGSEPVAAARKVIERCNAHKIKLVSYFSDEYPPLLRMIDDPPLILYVEGSISTKPSVAIVGTRRSDPLSEAVTRRLSRAFALHGFSVVSGMARGIDRFAHETAIDEHGETSAVLACGLDKTYPAANADIYRRVRKSPTSALISEYPPGLGVQKWTFVQRNRIISGMCGIVVVVKAGLKSGAMITARFALEQNRDLFVCGGHAYDAQYQGCISLINQGAACIYDEETIFETLSLERYYRKQERKEPTYDEIDSDERKVRSLIEQGTHSIDELIRRLDMQPSAVQSLLVSLELGGHIMRRGPDVYLAL